MARFRTPEIPRDQAVLFPQKLDEVVPAEHPVRYLDLIFRSEPFNELFARWEESYSAGGPGQPPFHPRDLAALYVYGLLVRASSSRKLEDACKVRVDVMWLMSGQRPDHATIASFIKRSAEQLRELFKATVQVGLKAGLVKLEHVSVDGTKIEAAASKDSLKSEKRIEELIEEEVASRLAEFAENEAKEREMVSKREVSSKERERRLGEALAALQRRKKEASGNNKVVPVACVTDPDARGMKDKKGRTGPNYNGQITVDSDSGIIVAQALTDDPSDSGQLRQQIEQTKENCAGFPQEVSADSAYNTGPDLEHFSNKGVATYMPDSGESRPRLPEASQAALQALKAGQELSKEQIAALPRGRNKKLGLRCFTFDAQNEHYLCPMGAILKRVKESKDHQKCGIARRTQYRASAEVCDGCPLSGECRKNTRAGRVVSRDQYEPYRTELRARMDTEHGRKAYRKRAPTSETPFAVLKNILGIRRLSRRGMCAARTEWALFFTAINMRQLIQAFSVRTANAAA